MTYDLDGCLQKHKNVMGFGKGRSETRAISRADSTHNTCIQNNDCHVGFHAQGKERHTQKMGSEGRNCVETLFAAALI